MKKSYFITWLGALTTVLVAALSVSKKTKKYGQKIHSGKLIKVKADDFSDLADKGLDFVVKKIVK